MLMFPGSIQVFVATQATDMRKSFDSLAAIVKAQLQKDVFSGHFFVFCNKRGDRIKILYWDRNGFVLWYKRLERGVFRLPNISGKSFKITMQELSLLLEGIDLMDKKRFTAM